MGVLLHGLVVLVVEGHRGRKGRVVWGVELVYPPASDGSLCLQDVAVLCGAKTLARDPLWQDL